jgi:hypothetical protein
MVKSRSSEEVRMSAWIKKLKASDARLILAATFCVVFLLVSSTTPEGSGTCTSGYGNLKIVNDTKWDIHVTLYNPVQHTYLIVSKSSTLDRIRAGKIDWTALATREERDVGGAPGMYRDGSCQLKKDQTVTILIDYLN